MAHGTRLARTGLLLPAALLAALLGTIGWQTGLIALPHALAADGLVRPVTVRIAARQFSHRAPGAFQTAAGTVLDAPLVTATAPAPLEIMAYQVSSGEYGRCVAAGACKPLRGRMPPPTHPVTGVSYLDAEAYAGWLSAATGTIWRLPTVAEWVLAAAERAVDPALGQDGSSDNPAEIWLATYAREAQLSGAAAALSGPTGSGGRNSLGVADLAGPVWEWTATCDSRTTLGPDGEVASHVEACGVRLLEGQHRTPMSSFVRDARSGGCSTGRPPDALGFRLVREAGFWDRLFGG